MLYDFMLLCISLFISYLFTNETAIRIYVAYILCILGLSRERSSRRHFLTFVTETMSMAHSATPPLIRKAVLGGISKKFRRECSFTTLVWLREKRRYFAEKDKRYNSGWIFREEEEEDFLWCFFFYLWSFQTDSMWQIKSSISITLTWRLR